MYTYLNKIEIQNFVRVFALLSKSNIWKQL